jgi:hypothetical protein
MLVNRVPIVMRRWTGKLEEPAVSAKSPPIVEVRLVADDTKHINQAIKQSSTRGPGQATVGSIYSRGANDVRAQTL